MSFILIFLQSMITTTFTYPMPVLTYSTEALEPVISQKTVDYHYGKHLKTYVDNLNRLVRDTPFSGMDLEDIVRTAPEGALFNNAGQVLNHKLYFEQFAPFEKSGKQPRGRLLEAINSSFGNFQEFQKQMNEASVKLFGSGWVWLAKDEAGMLMIVSEPNGSNPVRENLTPLLGFDVWEHAYYLDYQNRRKDHIEELWEIIDWEVIQRRMED